MYTKFVKSERNIIDTWTYGLCIELYNEMPFFVKNWKQYKLQNLCRNFLLTNEIMVYEFRLAIFLWGSYFEALIEVILHNCRPLYKCVCYGMLNMDFFNNKIERFLFLIYITIVLAINYISSRMYRYQNDFQ